MRTKDMTEFIQYFISTVLCLDGLACLLFTIQFARDFKHNPQDYINRQGRLTCKQIVIYFACGTLLCWALMLMTILL